MASLAADAEKPVEQENPLAGEGLRGAGGDDGDIDGNDIETNWDESVDTFDALELREDLLRGIYAYGFEKPSAIQQVRPAG